MTFIFQRAGVNVPIQTWILVTGNGMQIAAEPAYQ